MKKICASLLVMLFMESCEITTLTNSSEDSTLVKIECFNDSRLEQYIVQQMKSIKGRDITINKDGDFLNIESAYMDRDIPRYKIENMVQNMSQLPGVLHVQIEKNNRVVRQSF